MKIDDMYRLGTVGYTVICDGCRMKVMDDVTIDMPIELGDLPLWIKKDVKNKGLGSITGKGRFLCPDCTRALVDDIGVQKSQKAKWASKGKRARARVKKGVLEALYRIGEPADERDIYDYMVKNNIIDKTQMRSLPDSLLPVCQAQGLVKSEGRWSWSITEYGIRYLKEFMEEE